MRIQTGFVTQLSAAVALSLAVAAGAAQPPVRVLLITGHNNHNWKYTSRHFADTLEWTGRFDVDITDDPASTLADAAALRSYSVFVLDYNDFGAPKRWGARAEANFVEAVRGGTGVVAVHSANNAFPGWKEYEQMIGLMWRDGTGHGAFHSFEVQVTDAAHPIFAGLPAAWTTPGDELYHKLVNSQNAPYKMLARALATKESGGTGVHEPMAITLEFGAGRVFATPLGHVWTGQEGNKVSISNEPFRTMLSRATEWAATGVVTLPAAWVDTIDHNALTQAERDAGWRLLFDGKDAQFRGWKKDSIPAGWRVGEGVIHLEPRSRAGDIITVDQFTDFEFVCQWKAAPGANSGIIYRCTEDHQWPWETGPEMQILDNARHPDGKKPQTSAGSLYDILAISADVVRPAGEWNHARVVARGTKIEHWLNGFKVIDIDFSSPEYKALHGKSKWPGMPSYGTRPKGHIALQEHGDEVWFRGIKVRELKEPATDARPRGK